MKKLILLSIILSAVSLPSMANQVLLSPNYEDPRFEPSDKFHAGCASSLDVNLETIQNVKQVNLVMSYNPDEIEIIRIVPDISSPEENFEQKIEYGKIRFSKNNPNYVGTSQNLLLKNKKLFKLEFKSLSDITWSVLHLINWSYLINENNEKISFSQVFDLQFVKVPECQPDIMPPSVKLIQPKNTVDKLPLDTYFIFDVKDNDKWVDKKNVTIDFDWKVYDYESDSVRRSWNYLLFYPEDWLEINKNLKLKLKIQDRQIYGWANFTEKIFSFETTSWVSFKNYITPSKFRNLVYQTKETLWTEFECDLVSKLYIRSDISLKIKFKSLLNKLNCKIPTEEETKEYMNSTLINKTDINIKNSLKKLKSDSKNSFISVFAAVWRILFVVTLLLKIHYMVGYHVQKKKNKYYKELTKSK